MKNIISWICIVAMLLLIAIGRVKSFHLTEGEALIAYWEHWSGALVFAGIVIWLKAKP